MGWGSVVCYEVRFGRHGSVRCGVISRDSVKLGMAGTIRLDKTWYGSVCSGRRGWFGAIWLGPVGFFPAGSVRFGVACSGGVGCGPTWQAR